MHRWFTVCTTVFFFLIMSVDAAKKRTYTTGIGDLVRAAFRRSFHHLVSRQASYDSDVFRYTQLALYGIGGLYAGESCRLSATICSFDEHCCSGRCICRRWLTMGEQRCVRKCL